MCNYTVSDIENPPPEFEGHVDIEEFWRSVDQEIICRGFLQSSPGPLRTRHRPRCTPRLHPGRGLRSQGPLLVSNLQGSGPDEKTPGKTTSGPTVTVPSLTRRYGTNPASFPKPGPYQGLAPTCSKRELFPPGVHSSRSHTPPDCARRPDLTPWRGVRPHTFDSCHHSRSDSACRCPARQAKRWRVVRRRVEPTGCLGFPGGMGGSTRLRTTLRGNDRGTDGTQGVAETATSERRGGCDGK
ncbi:hypothetical protein E1301_Tti015656 [Triplophysa tibetana]|uniref:Uncharacterized protein n=1 Tax=Triplophysa tibetana TaxID=1572043 RepID=A0A5A9PKV9_9TELE|nr:hypothetical protein E1301_Tti015656 [Triplophysa tibetana]